MKETHGPVGSRIRGSSLLRAYCARCGEAMRVQDANIDNYCGECDPKRPPAHAENLTPRQAAKLGRTSA